MIRMKKERASKASEAKHLETSTALAGECCGLSKGECCFKKHFSCIGTLVTLLFALLAFIFSYKGYQLEVLKAGGKQNFNEMNAFYASSEYVKYVTDAQKEQLASFKQMMGMDQAEEQSGSVKQAEGTEPSAEGDTTEAVGKVLDQEKIASLKADAKIKGNKDAEVTILEFADVNCGYCKRQIAQTKTIATLMEKHPNVNLIYKNMPVLGSVEQAQVLECVGSQVDTDAYYAFVEQAYAAQDTSLDNLATLAEGLGANKDKVVACVKDATFQKAVDTQMSEGRSFGISGTPASVVINNANGKYVLIEGAYPLDEFENALTTVLN